MTATGADLSLSVTADGVALWIHVSPRARRTGVGPRHGDALRVAVREPPVAGAANAACARALANALGIAPQAVQLDPGASGRRKRVRIRGDTAKLAQRLRQLAAPASGD